MPHRDQAQSSSIRRKKILLVDDSQTALMAQRVVLSRLPCDIIVAHDGEEAVKKALDEHPDVILMDVVLPKMDGYQACRAIRCRSETKSIPIIMVTTRGKPEHIAAGYRSGCNDYLTKPIDSNELIARVWSHLE